MVYGVLNVKNKYRGKDAKFNILTSNFCQTVSLFPEPRRRSQRMEHRRRSWRRRVLLRRSHRIKTTSLVHPAYGRKWRTSQRRAPTNFTATSAALPATTSRCAWSDVALHVLSLELELKVVCVSGLCSVLQNFRTHMNSISHQQRMMEIQHMSNACLVTLLPRVQESLQGAVKDGSVLFCFFFTVETNQGWII